MLSLLGILIRANYKAVLCVTGTFEYAVVLLMPCWYLLPFCCWRNLWTSFCLHLHNHFYFWLMVRFFFLLDQVRLAQLFKAEGLMPTTRDPERFSFWVCIYIRFLVQWLGLNLIPISCGWCNTWMQLATLTNRRPSERLDLLRIRDTNEVPVL